MVGCAKLTQKYGYPNSAIKKGQRLAVVPLQKKQTTKFDPSIIFPSGDDSLYPL